jgi:hypothetical protein
MPGQSSSIVTPPLETWLIKSVFAIIDSRLRFEPFSPLSFLTQLKQVVASDFLEDPPLTVFKQPRFIYVRGHSIFRKPGYQGGKLQFDDGFTTLGGVTSHIHNLRGMPTPGNACSCFEGIKVHRSPETGCAVVVGLGHVTLNQGLPAGIGSIVDSVFGLGLQTGASRQQGRRGKQSREAQAAGNGVHVFYPFTLS